MAILRTVNWRLIGLGVFVLFGAGTRLIPYDADLKQQFPGWWNFMPIGAMALFGGVCFRNRLMSFVVPFAAMFISDVWIQRHLGMPLFYGWSMLAVYVGFAVYVSLGLWVRRHRHVVTIIGASIVGSVQFFLVTNFMTWVDYDFYPKTAAGLWDCYLAAIPFFRGTLLGDLAYVGVFFGGLAVAQW